MRFWLQKVGMAVLLLLAVTFAAFTALNSLGDPLFNILGPVANDTTNPESVAKIEAAEQQYHLDDPLPVRYGKWLGDFVTGDFGVQFSSDGQPPVSNLIAERAPRSIVLLVLAQFFALLISVPWAIVSASREGSGFDRFSTLATFVIVSIPGFALAVIFKMVFGYWLDWFPASYRANDAWPAQLHAMILPAFTIGLTTAIVYQRLLRTDLITTLQEDFILTARAKGVPRRSVLLRHALRPSLFSLITVFGINTGALIGGALVVEWIFVIPGLGWSVIDAVFRNDFPVVLAIVVLVSVAFVIINLIVDILYSVIDPRVRKD